MAVHMRLTRVGGKKNPIYRVVVADSRSPRDGKFLEIIGRYNPQTEPSTIELDEDKVKEWLGKGAQPTRGGLAAAQGQEHWLTSSSFSPGSWWTTPTRCGSRRTRTSTAGSSCTYTSPRTDVGKVIGRQGRIARALRTVLRACAAGEDRRVQLEIA